MPDEHVVFDETPSLGQIPLPRPQPPTMERALLRAQIVSSPGDASIVLAIGAALLVIASFYLIASAIPPVPTLGADQLLPGEQVPAYIKTQHP